VTVPAGGQQTATFTTTPTAAGTYQIDVDGVSGTLTVKEAPVAPTSKVSWWLIGGVIAGIVAIATVVLLLLRRREA
jgi:hypothetical protein